MVEKERREEEKKKREKEIREEEENPGLEISYVMFGTFVWKLCVWIMYGNLPLSKLCRKISIRSVVGWYEMSFMVYFEFWLSCFWFGRKFLVKRAKTGPFLHSARHPYA